MSTRPPEDAAAPAQDDVARLAAVAAGDAAATAWLLDDVAPTVYGFILARVGGHAAVAEDLLQETLLEGLRSRHTFRGGAALGTWLCAIARRRVARHYEAERRADVARSGLRRLPPPPGDSEEEVVDRRDEVLAALGCLPALHRQVLVLKYLDGFSVEQIAATVGKSAVQVQSLLQRSRDGLRRQLEAGDG